MNKKSAALLSIFSNSFLIIFKLISGILMGSISVLSEAIHSGLDLVASIIAFISIKQSMKPKDEEHPFGHGKFENVSGFVEAILIFIAAGIIIVEASKKLIGGVQIESLNAGIIVMLISSLINLCISMLLFKIAKKEDSIALEADAMHLLTDVFTSFGVFLGLIVIKITGIQIIDPIIAIVVATMIIKASIDLTKKSLIDLVDTSLPPEDLNKIKELLSSHPRIKSFHKLRTRKSGATREIDFHICVDEEISIFDAHSISHEVKEEIEKELLGGYVTVHIEPECEKES
ncbi:cation diffusion facilitator family transporter [Clostridium cylindrosporum]|uniref:Cation diffusion facilitator family transporter n=1 Tax=Clostridium cylindrosporum DSM 605 TaxID=1121307 RepID=A0A0J8D9V2_CLOCY|nr:cation diffusion facilitator family transporter [Clostridium cylindrosporum]KMT22835.1 cation diffusion facilitator family transporter [Clostridium cylindrosporum DSM 605]